MKLLITYKFGLTIAIPRSKYQSFSPYYDFKITPKGTLLGYWNSEWDRRKDTLATGLNPKMKLVRRGYRILIFKDSKNEK